MYFCPFSLPSIFIDFLRISTSCISRLVSSLFWHFQVRSLILVHSLYSGDVLETFNHMWLFRYVVICDHFRGRHLKASSDFSKKVPYYQKFLEHLPYINCVPVSEFSLENVKIKMKLVVTYNLLKYGTNILIILINLFIIVKWT